MCLLYLAGIVFLQCRHASSQQPTACNPNTCEFRPTPPEILPTRRVRKSFNTAAVNSNEIPHAGAADGPSPGKGGNAFQPQKLVPSVKSHHNFCRLFPPPPFSTSSRSLLLLLSVPLGGFLLCPCGSGGGGVAFLVCGFRLGFGRGGRRTVLCLGGGVGGFLRSCLSRLFMMGRRVAGFVAELRKRRVHMPDGTGGATESGGHIKPCQIFRLSLRPTDCTV